MESIPSCPMSLRVILILSSNLNLGPQNGLFLSGYLINIIYAFLSAPEDAYILGN